MRRLVDVLLLFVVVAGCGFLYLDRAAIVEMTHELVYGPPCSKPEMYSIGTFDPRFHLSREQALGIVERAANAWNTTSRKDLLEYTPQGGDVTINFLYDRRQQVTEQLSSLNSNLSQSNASLAQQQSEYQSQKASLEAQKQTLDAEQAAYEAALASYNQTVSYWNDQGGAPPSEVQKLDAERSRLNAQQSALQQGIQSYNALVQQVNSLAAQLNATVGSHNANVSAYNSLAESTGPEFTEGEYVQSGNSREIDIYQFSNENKLLRVMEHEFGHSLGLQHVSDPQAIMYPDNTGTALVPTAADLSELDQVCSSALK